jgi:cytochrome c-type biogenesis protein CcmH
VTGFWLGAGLLAIAALALLYRPRRGALALAIGVLAVSLALLLYRTIDNWQPVAQSAVEQQARAEIAALQRSARDHASDGTAWLRLGQKYLQYEQYALAGNALRTANRIFGGHNAAALAGLAEAMALDGDESNDGQVAPLFENVLQLEPRNGKALFYTGLKALHDGQLTLARERFSAMLGPEVPAEVQAALQKQIAAIDAELAAVKGSGKAVSSDADSASATVVAIEIRVATSVRAAFDAQAKAGAPLFVFVRNPQGGPPLAVKRLAATQPIRITLSARDAMLAGNGIRPHQQLTVAARLSARGAPTASSGDIYGEAGTQAGSGKPVVILIDRIAP